jgi:hypothetical protein
MAWGKYLQVQEISPTQDLGTASLEGALRKSRKGRGLVRKGGKMGGGVFALTDRQLVKFY